MLAVLFSLIAAAGYGIGDYFGALASRRLHPVAVSVVGHSASTVVTVIALAFVPSIWSSTGTISGIVAGACEAIGFLVFYYVLAVGPVSIVAPLVSVIYAVVPVLWAYATGEQLSFTAQAGIVLGLAAVLALSLAPGNHAQGDDDRDAELDSPKRLKLGWAMVGLAAIGGITWGFATVALDVAPDDSGVSPAVAGAITALAIVLAVFLPFKNRFGSGFKFGAVRDSALSGGLFGFANAFILLALMTGALALVGLLTAMYPLATVLLARFALKEQISRVQWLGIAAAIAAAALMSLG